MMTLACKCGNVAQWFNVEHQTLHCHVSKRDAVVDGEPEENFKRLDEVAVPWSVIAKQGA